MMTIHVLTAGNGYEYLTRQVASGDARRNGRSLTGYYAESGYPPGRWIGSGLAGLDSGRGITGIVTTDAMALLYGTGCDPASGEPLGHRYRLPKPVEDRVAESAAHLPSHLDEHRRAHRIDEIRAEEQARRMPRPVAGFDCVFTPAKSISVLWALGDDATRQAALDAHHAAVAGTVAYMEREVARTRAGRGGIAQLDTRGLVAAAFDHWDSRPVRDPQGSHTDPNLHTHLVIANRVQGLDGRWRTLDSKALHHAVVACSERYNALVADELTRRLGARFVDRAKGRNRHPVREVAGIGDALIDEFSSRRAEVEGNLREMIGRFRTEHGREPSRAEQIKLAQTATLVGRSAKDGAHPPLAELLDRWRDRAAVSDGRTAERIVADATGHRPPLRRAADVPDEELTQIAAAARNEVAGRRATWTRWHVEAEVTRVTAPMPLATSDDRDALIRKATDVALAPNLALPLSSPALVPEPPSLRRADGESVFRRHNSDRYTSHEILDAETRLLEAAERTGAPAVDPLHAAATLEQGEIVTGRCLSADQAAAVRRIACSGRAVDALIGPAGTGKTTTMRALATVWQAAYGPGSVLLLAPSAAAAQVLSDAVRERGDNLAKWLYETVGDGAARRRSRAVAVTASWRRMTAHERATLDEEQERWSLSPGQLVVVDEASLAGTLALDTLRAQAEAAGAKLLLAGDPAQLTAVEAGGALRLISNRTGAAELTSVWRFAHRWEADASLALRAGDLGVVDTYDAHHRLVSGSDEAMADAAYANWLADESNGRVSLLVAADNATVAELNARARGERQGVGAVASVGVRLADGTATGVGDRIVTRHNDRSLLVCGGQDFVKNGDLWTVESHEPAGALVVRHTGHGGRVRLPAPYVAAHVQLGYATTAHRAQGMTVDTAHLVATAALTRELLYVGMTRGTHGNAAYVVTESTLDPTLDHAPDKPVTAHEVLVGVLRRVGAETSATETIHAEQLAEDSTGTLLARAEYASEHEADDPELDRYVEALRATLGRRRTSPSDALQRLSGDPVGLAPDVREARRVHR